MLTELTSKFYLSYIYIYYPKSSQKKLWLLGDRLSKLLLTLKKNYSQRGKKSNDSLSLVSKIRCIFIWYYLSNLCRMRTCLKYLVSKDVLKIIYILLHSKILKKVSIRKRKIVSRVSGSNCYLQSKQIS